MKLLICMIVVALWLLSAHAWSQTAQSASPPDPVVSAARAQAEPPKTTPPLPTLDSPKYFLEVGGFFSQFTPAGTSWRGADARLMYSGWKKLTPFGGLSTTGSSLGSQVNFGLGSYVHINKHFYTICGFSVSPNSAIAFYPRARFDIAGMVSMPKVKGLIISSGFTEIRPYPTGGGGRILSVGGIYYHHLGIFSGSVNFNEALPSGQRSTSGQFGYMRGTHGNYYLSLGASGGKVAYQLITNVPFDVRYETIGTFVSVQKWLARHFGITARYDYQRAIDNFSRHTVRGGLFFEF